MIKPGIYKTRSGLIACVDRIAIHPRTGCTKAMGWLKETPNENEIHGRPITATIQMDWNLNGAISDFDHKPWTDICLVPDSWRERQPHDPVENSIRTIRHDEAAP